MKLSPHNTELIAQLRNCNYQVCRARIVTEIAYGCLKARWCHLLKRNHTNIDIIPHVIIAACVLHNICEVYHEQFNDAWLQTERDYA